MILAAHAVWLVCDWMESARDAAARAALTLRCVTLLRVAILIEAGRGRLLVAAGRMAGL